MRSRLILLGLFAIVCTASAQNWDRFNVAPTADLLPNYSCPADLDGDGDMDILYVSINTGDFRWAENIDATANDWADHLIYEDFYTAVNSIGAADLDGDGDMDVFISRFTSHGMQWFENTAGDGSDWGLNSLSLYTDDYTINSVIAIDLDVDGDMDLVAANDDDSYPIAGWINEGDGTWTRDSIINLDANGGAYDVAGGDMDNDGDIDFAGSCGLPTGYWWGNCVGTAFADYMISETDGAFAVALADFNGDGVLDLAGAPRYEDNELKVYLKDGNAWNEIVVVEAMFHDDYWDIVAGDVDQDGDDDLVTVDAEGFVLFHENEDGDGTNWYSHSIGMITNARTVHLADINGDSVPDVVTVDQFNGVCWLQNPAEASLGEIYITDNFGFMSEDEGMIQWVFDLFTSADGGNGDPYLDCYVELLMANPTALTSVRGKLVSDDLPGIEVWVDFALDGTMWTADITRPVTQNMYPVEIARRLDDIYSFEFADDDIVSIPWPGMEAAAPRVRLVQVEAVHPSDGTLVFDTDVTLPDYRDQLNAHAEDNGRVTLSYDYIQTTDSDLFDMLVGDAWDDNNPNYTGYINGEHVREIPWSAAVSTPTEELVFTMESFPYPKIRSNGSATIDVQSLRSSIGNRDAKLGTFTAVELTPTSICSVHVFQYSGWNVLLHDAAGDGEYEEEIEADLTGVEFDDNQASLPRSSELVQIYPNPFNPTTTVSVTLDKPTDLTVRVVDLLGREVATLTNGRHGAGRYTMQFDGSHLASGVYLVQVQTDGITAMRKMALIK